MSKTKSTHGNAVNDWLGGINDDAIKTGSEPSLDSSYTQELQERNEDLQVQVEQSLITLGDNKYRFRRFVMEGTELIIPPDVENLEMYELGAMFSGNENLSSWWRGKWADFLTRNLKDDFERGKRYDWMADTFGLSKKTLQNQATVYRFFEDPSCRHEGLSFSHHQLVSGRDDAQELLDYAYNNTLSANQLRAYMRPKAKRPSAMKRFEQKTVHPLRDKLLRFRGKDRIDAIEKLETMLAQLKAQSK